MLCSVRKTKTVTFHGTTLVFRNVFESNCLILSVKSHFLSASQAECQKNRTFQLILPGVTGKYISTSWHSAMESTLIFHAKAVTGSFVKTNPELFLSKCSKNSK